MTNKNLVKVSDFIAEKLAAAGIKHVFMITGGGAMHLNMSIGRHPRLKYICGHNEQGSSISAESYARLTGKTSALCVTSGPGSTNAITGVHCAWTDSIPMIILSGQVKRETTVRSTGLALRQLGDQEVDITKIVASITKYAVMVSRPESIGYHVDRALYLASHGRPGPVWLDVPVDVQGALVDIRKLKRYNPSEDKNQLPPGVTENTAEKIIKLVKQAKRPVILAGTGVRLSGAQKQFLQTVKLLNIPVLTAWNAHDCVEHAHPLYFGRPGTLGDRAGNFIIQNSDLLISVGCRLNVRQIGYSFKLFARNAYKIIVDIDALELKKPTIRPDMPVTADAGDFLNALLKSLRDKPLEKKTDWLNWCADKKSRYPVVLDGFRRKSGKVNPYFFMETLGKLLREDDIVVCGDGTACVTAFQVLPIKHGQRLYTNSGAAPMGYDVPAALGAQLAAPDKRVVCLAGDGSFQMNCQELQTIAHHKLPVKIFYLNNSGYSSIRQTQRHFFKDGLVGCDCKSGVSFPDIKFIAKAYGIKYSRCSGAAGLEKCVAKTLKSKTAELCELLLDAAQPFAPKTASRALPGGSIVSPPLEDMWPFLDRKEFLKNMIIPPAEEWLK